MQGTERPKSSPILAIAVMVAVVLGGCASVTQRDLVEESQVRHTNEVTLAKGIRDLYERVEALEAQCAAPTVTRSSDREFDQDMAEAARETDAELQPEIDRMMDQIKREMIYLVPR